jgi:hypothetical protein
LTPAQSTQCVVAVSSSQIWQFGIVGGAEVFKRPVVAVWVGILQLKQPKPVSASDFRSCSVAQRLQIVAVKARHYEWCVRLKVEHFFASKAHTLPTSRNTFVHRLVHCGCRCCNGTCTELVEFLRRRLVPQSSTNFFGQRFSNLVVTKAAPLSHGTKQMDVVLHDPNSALTFHIDFRRADSHCASRPTRTPPLPPSTMSDLGHSRVPPPPLCQSRHLRSRDLILCRHVFIRRALATAHKTTFADPWN